MPLHCQWQVPGLGGPIQTRRLAQEVGATYELRSHREADFRLFEVWEFRVEVVSNNIKHRFTARTDMEWRPFLDEAREYFDTLGSKVQLGFQFNGEAGPMSMLTNEQEWAEAMVRLREKVRASRTRAVLMEIKNMVSQVAYDEERIQTYLWILAARVCAESLKGTWSRKGERETWP